MNRYLQVSTTTESESDAKTIANEVVKKRLAACAQVMGPMVSTYWWRDRLEQEEEWLCLMKTTQEYYGRLERAIQEIHPYEEPEIIAVPIVAGSRGYLSWLEQEVGDE
jgi:periplasmic divalent cation tolerance protein